MDAKTNGQERAYPADHARGLTKRELFAAMAMQGILADGFSDELNSAKNIARRAVNYADALLAELAKGPQA